MVRIALFSDVHGNVRALDAVRKAVRIARPDFVAIAGDHVLNGPNPVETIDGIRAFEAEGAAIIQGNTDIAVADFDFTAAFPWYTDGVPESMRAAAEWAHDQIGPDRVDWLRRLPAERRIRLEDDTLVLVCHASPGSQTAGLDSTLDPSVILERMSRTDARVVGCGHTHLAEIRDYGWRVIVNGGSAGYALDGDPTAGWAIIDIADGVVTAELKRAEFDAVATADEISARGLPGDVYRAATVRTGKLVR
jgi:predicted phosphodiesterase